MMNRLIWILSTNRPERCLFLSSTKQEIKEICEVPMGGQPLRISVLNVWVGTDTEYINKNPEDTHFSIEENSNQASHLNRRHPTGGILHGGDMQSKGHTSL